MTETWDVLRAALAMRGRLPRPGAESPQWADTWAVFSVLVPVLVLAANLAVVELPPFFLHVRTSSPFIRMIAAPDFGWIAPFGTPAFRTLLILQAAAVVAVLAGRRWVALAVILGSTAYTLKWWGFFPAPVVLVTALAYILEIVALVASPGPRRGRSLLTWGHGVVLVLAVAAIKVSSLIFYELSLPEVIRSMPLPVVQTRYEVPFAGIVLAAAAALATAAIAGPAVLRQGRLMCLLITALLYPYVTEFVALILGIRYADFYQAGNHNGIFVFLMPLMMAALAVLIAARRRLVSPDARLTPGQ